MRHILLEMSYDIMRFYTRIFHLFSMKTSSIVMVAWNPVANAYLRSYIVLCISDIYLQQYLLDLDAVRPLNPGKIRGITSFRDRTVTRSGCT